MMLKPTPRAVVSDCALEAVRRYLSRDGSSLGFLMDAIDMPSGIDAFIELEAEYRKQDPNPSVIQRELLTIQRLLSDQSPEYLDLLGRAMNYSASDATRWHGARVSELLGRFL